jgi:hypothetical protein
MPYKFNPFTGNFDYYELVDGVYVKIAGDTMTGDLTVPTLYATDTGSSKFNSDVILKSGVKLIFDGA